MPTLHSTNLPKARCGIIGMNYTTHLDLPSSALKVSDALFRSLEVQFRQTEITVISRAPKQLRKQSEKFSFGLLGHLRLYICITGLRVGQLFTLFNNLCQNDQRPLGGLGSLPCSRVNSDARPYAQAPATQARARPLLQTLAHDNLRSLAVLDVRLHMPVLERAPTPPLHIRRSFACLHACPCPRLLDVRHSVILARPLVLARSRSRLLACALLRLPACPYHASELPAALVHVCARPAARPSSPERAALAPEHPSKRSTKSPDSRTLP
ncbi:hypothetical protein CRG98_011369 [Punica granatum]|uniref:Uncharacterized protein n=1 Tax=Punica granatum TaxID=22663 RepID=A0A2I0KJ57_PUNGR|nr:hypothetical protein CRG98_011369 [Punica granatum]